MDLFSATQYLLFLTIVTALVKLLSFAGLSANAPFYNLTTALAMMAGRFALAIPALGFAAYFARQRTTPSSSGTASLIIMVALSYLPALALGPIVERLLFRA